MPNKIQFEFIRQKWYKPPLVKLLNDVKIGEFEIPKNFVSKGVSTPRISVAVGWIVSLVGFYALKSLLLMFIGIFMIYMPIIFNRFGDGLPATLLHDYLLDNRLVTYNSAATFFKDQLENDNVGFIRRNVMWLVILIYGNF